MINFYLISILITLIENVTIATIYYNKAKKENKLNNLATDYITTIKNVNPLIIVPGVNIVKNILNILTFKEEYNKFIKNNTIELEEITKEVEKINEEINEEIIQEKNENHIKLNKLSTKEIWKSFSVEEKKELLSELLQEEIKQEELDNILKLIK